MKKGNKQPSLEELEKVVNELGKDLSGITKEYVGNGYIWRIQAGKYVMRTNNAGKAMFEKALLEEGKKLCGK